MRLSHRSKPFPSYDIHNLYVSEESMMRLGLDGTNIPSDVVVASRRQIRELIAGHDVVLTD